MATRNGDVIHLKYTFTIFKPKIKMKSKVIFLVWLLIVCFVKIGNSQVITPQKYRQLKTMYQKIKQEYVDCLTESKELKEKNDSLMNSTKIITMKSESLHAFESKIKPAIPGGYIQTPINSKLLANMKLYKDAEMYIEKQFYQAGFTDAKRFLVNGGFGIASDIENLKKDGSSEDPPKRFDLRFDFSDVEGTWLERFLYPRSAGKTRMFLFVVTNQPFNAKGEKLDFNDILVWMENGLTSLPLDIASTNLDTTYKMHVLVYEYEVTDVNSKGKLNKSGISVIDHLKKAKLWQQEMGM